MDSLRKSNQEIFRDLRLLITYTLKLSVWEPHWLTKKERLARLRRNERRKKLVRELRERLCETLTQRLRAA